MDLRPENHPAVAFLLERKRNLILKKVKAFLSRNKHAINFSSARFEQAARRGAVMAIVSAPDESVVSGNLNGYVTRWLRRELKAALDDQKKQ